MSLQNPDGTWRCDDRRYYCAGNQSVLYQETSSVSASSQQHQPSAQQASYPGIPLGAVPPSNVADALSKIFQCSIEPYQQQPQPVFGRDLLASSYGPSPVMALDPNFRAAAARDEMIWGFVRAMDSIAKGPV
jgi:hypothetical protein